VRWLDFDFHVKKYWSVIAAKNIIVAAIGPILDLALWAVALEKNSIGKTRALVFFVNVSAIHLRVTLVSRHKIDG
jgi:hypothetical protein